jgi:outer membrane protein assembly factor BamB
VSLPIPFWFEPGVTLECDPVLVGNRVLIATLDAAIHAVELATGRRVWSSKLRGTTVHGLSLADGVVYISVAFTGFSGPGTIWALDGDSGAELWVHKAKEHVGTGPAVADGLVFYGTASGNILNGRGVLVALDAATRRARWTVAAGPFAGRPVVAEGGRLICATGESIACFDRMGGTMRWSVPTGKFITATPLVIDDVVVAGSFDHRVYSLALADGRERWRFDAGGPVRAMPVVRDGVVYVGSYGGALYALDLRTGRRRWRYTTGSEVLSTPCVTEDSVFAGCSDATLHAVARASGRRRWFWQAPDVARGGIIARPVAAGDRLLVANRNGGLYELDLLDGTVIERSPAARTAAAPRRPRSSARAPRVVRRAAGELALASGRLVVCDPISDPDDRALPIAIAPGRYPVSLGLARWGKEDERVAYVLLRFAAAAVRRWTRVRLGKGKSGTPLTIGVDSGYVALLSVEAAGRIMRNRAANERFGEAATDQLDACYRPTRSWASIAVASKDSPDVFMCSSGLGDGDYPVFCGLSPGGKPVALLIDLKVLGKPATRVVSPAGSGSV